ncbi:TenA family protein [cf. Phormidesmis sp. LEGE 11477]|uniref:TenA family protein n=1 Tax=cf. Phormidesmis sp. LEGE 11477 TaxID=1828680 RepID=UPI00187E5395|nr:TenA family protein [cf. Phormidesmis sp. LEGE 11477]MBE9060201.1 TenA family protein [cf. Phormidesmis sp. LEGE 11477]
MSLSQTLWQANQDLVAASLNNPFVQGIGDGSLLKEKFAYYVGQDAFFLEAFARAYSIAAAKAPDWESFQTFHALANGVLQELNLHHSYAQSWNVDIKSVEPGSATRQYTDFLLSTAWAQPIGITAVAMCPCMRLYAYIGQQLASQQKGDNPAHDYQDWITTYSSDEFEPLAKQLESLVDLHSPDSSLTRSTYRYAMVCERDFFQAAWQQ